MMEASKSDGKSASVSASTAPAVQPQQQEQQQEPAPASAASVAPAAGEDAAADEPQNQQPQPETPTKAATVVVVDAATLSSTAKIREIAHAALERIEHELPVRSRWRHELPRLYLENATTTLSMEAANVTVEVVHCLSDYVSYINTPLLQLQLSTPADDPSIMTLYNHHQWFSPPPSSLSRNPIGPKGAVLLGKALVTNNTLQVLALDDCALVGSAFRPEYDGLLALAKGIQSPRSSLTHLK